MFKTKLSR